MVDNTGNTYIVLNGSVDKYNSSGTFQQTYTYGTGIQQVFINNLNQIIALANYGNSIEKFDTSFSHLGTLVNNVYESIMALDSTGNIYTYRAKYDNFGNKKSSFSSDYGLSAIDPTGTYYYTTSIPSGSSGMKIFIKL